MKYKFLYEFSAIFIAVFMGFIAEHLREEYSESINEHRLISVLINELNQDTTKINKCIELNESKIKYLDSLVDLRHLDFSKDENLKLFYYTFYNTAMPYVDKGGYRFSPSGSALEQIKVTGAITYAKPETVAEIIKYDNMVSALLDRDRNYLEHTEETFRLSYRLCDFPSIFDNELYPPKFTADEKAIELFFNLSYDLKYTVRQYVRYLVAQKKATIELLTFLEMKYETGHLGEKRRE